MEEIIRVWIKIFSINMIRYVLFSGVAWLIFYVIYKRYFEHKKIQSKEVERKKVRQEIKHSVISLGIFAMMGVVIFIGKKYGIFHIYRDFSDHSFGYFVLSILGAILFHDTYFYWTHRFMHLKWVFPHVHRVHHLSNNPTPWAAFSFHPLEAVIEAAILPLIVFLWPMHPLAIIIFLIYMTGMNVMGHLGYEMYPKWFLKSKLGRLNNTSVHHNMHHRLVNCNYGLYFNVWDLLLGTNHKNYESEFERIALRTQKEEFQPSNTSMVNN